MRYLPSSYHRPLLPNGQYPPIDWQLYGYMGACCWPPAINISKWRYIVDTVMIMCQFISECSVLFGEMQLMCASLDDISFVCAILAPFLILFEMMLRAYNIIYKRASFRVHLEEFYKKIYIERSWNPELFEQIRRQQLPTKYSTSTYIITLVTYFYVPIMGLIHQQRLLPFPVIYKYDYKATFVGYLLFLAMALWTGFAVVGPLIAEANMLAMQILHLNARYTLLLRDLRKICQNAIEGHAMHKGEGENATVTSRFRYGLIDVVRRNVELNKFAESLQEQYSFRVFVMMALSATLLCVLGFLTATIGLSTDNIRFVTWIIGKVIELLIFGRLGTTLSTTTNELSTSYYSCGWEDVILHSTDAVENAKLMKLMALAIHLNSNPFRLSGLAFFYVNYEVVVSILRGAGSYFTVIYAYR
ncbi:odorant receptor 74a-like [Rhagoletis pomonella]|uniref:odorant receptor 74a-like n=1 Tax=Rhagoletis pomonella TaxID=28610 RepID=UPI001780BAA9|nr:odorant receptor 74a-like [Rhagoletis pomonella]XP_036344390.1 odorant receptor 74a-like [Rhagoletis pomonella]